MGQGSNRNSFCSCGSGKKYKNCCLNKKNRHIVYHYDFGKEVTAYIDYSPNDGLTFKKDGLSIQPEFASISLTQERDNKDPKQILNIPLSADDRSYNFNLYEAFLQFDCIYIIDTNTLSEPIKGEYISAGCILEYERLFQNIQNKIEPIPGKCYRPRFTHKEKGLGEKILLVNLVANIINERISKNPNVKIGIVTDHGLGDLDMLNSGKIPILSGSTFFYLTISN